jgi:hypothetical protein
LKVKDELAGRKVKCPSCGGGVLVPANEEDEEAAAARPKQQAREEPDEEERPRKKKKKKKKSNKGLVIGLVVGGVVLVAVVVLVIVLNRPSGQADKGNVVENPPPKQNPAQQFVPPPERHPDERTPGIRAAIDLEEIKNDLRQIGIYYNIYRNTNNRGPADVKAFVDSFRREAGHIAKKFDERFYGLFLVRNPNSNTVVAYEEPGEISGHHVVVYGDGRVDVITRQELQALKKQHNKK